MKKIILWSFISFSILSYSEAFALVSVSGNATYSGSKTGTIYVMAYMGSGCGDLGVPGYAVIDNPGPYTMNIPTGTFYICAYRDVNGNGMQDIDEPAGSYINNPINLPTDGATINGINLTLYDPQNQAIPTLSEWGMIIFSLMLAGSAIWMMRRRQVS